jgi:hypothetical protein
MTRTSRNGCTRLLIGLCVWLLLGLGAVAQDAAERPTPPTEKVTLRYQPEVGAERDFIVQTKCRIDIEGRGLAIQLDRMGFSAIAKVTQRVIDSQPNRIEIETDSEVLQSDPEPAPDEEYPKAKNILIMDERHSLVAVEDAPGAPQEENTDVRDLVLQAMNGLVFPEEPVGVGDSWHVQPEIQMPEQDGEPGAVVKMDVKSEVTDRVLEGDRWVMKMHTELQVPIQLPQASGNIGIHLLQEIYEDTGDIRYAYGYGRGSATPKLKVRAVKAKLRDFEIHLRRVLPDGRLLGSVDAPEEERIVDAPVIEPRKRAEAATEGAPAGDAGGETEPGAAEPAKEG